MSDKRDSDVCCSKTEETVTSFAVGRGRWQCMLLEAEVTVARSAIRQQKRQCVLLLNGRDCDELCYQALEMAMRVASR